VSYDLNLQRGNENILASADEHGISIFIGWTVGIPRDDAIAYVQTIGQDANAGFFPVNGKMVLSHNGAKLTLSEQEADAIVGLIQTAYGVA
jgi:hypothetical protein